MASPKKTTGRSAASTFIVWTVLTVVGCAPFGLPPSTDTIEAGESSGQPARCVPEFPDRGGWFGGDAAYSIPLRDDNRGEQTSLWLFGDSFVNTDDPQNGRQYPFVHNSIALTRCGPEIPWSIDYYWGGDRIGEPHAFFEPDPDSAWFRTATEKGESRPYYWLFDGFIAHGVLFVGLLRVQDSAPSGPFNLPFRLLGMDLARIENYREPPERWRIERSTLSENNIAFPGSAFVTSADFVYAFAFLDDSNGRSPRILGRLPVDALRAWDPDLSDDLEYYSADSVWQPGFDPADAKILMDDDATEMSVHFDQASESWFAVYSELGQGAAVGEGPAEGEPRSANSILLRRAVRLEGPWSPPITIFTPRDEIVALLDGRAAQDENLFCYAGKAHPQYSSRRDLLLTYVCSLYARTENESLDVLQRLAASPELYRARAAFLPVPLLAPSEPPAYEP